jgi:3-keto-disaccharide hydrolase
MSRDTKFLSLSLLLIAAPWLAQSQDGDWQVLFDGKTMHGWDDPAQKSPPGDSWTIEKGCLKARPKPRLREDLLTNAAFRDFELQFDWRVAPGANSGVKYRIQDHLILSDPKIEKFEDWVQYSLLHRRPDRPGKGQEYVIGFEYQVIDNGKHADARRGSKYQAAALYDLVGASQDVTRPVGEFNHARLVVKGNHVEHWLNGVKVVDADLAEAARAAAARWGDDSMVYKLLSTQPRKETPISLQNHGDAAWFRDIKIRALH